MSVVVSLLARWILIRILRWKYIIVMIVLILSFRSTDLGLGFADRRYSSTVVAGNKGANGPFAPLVRVTRNIMGTKPFNQLRGKAISLHSQGKTEHALRACARRTLS